ncbi:MYND finger domain-containing protein [Spironucleus salmonicida]|uniref:MYND finger domain-containing protein n=1 Tax=Spironucleus salmonicida TaxID=348837 RepID=V6M1Q9_9EUKA|nr:MYND finger domain-containing protein [Spironucleus salmonicida]|eukprot:EST47144.1 Hypothetical protein SS50377_12655 [Spironucleus salmonicida]
MDNNHHRMRALEVSQLNPIYPQITCMNCLKFITEKYRCSQCQKVYYCSQQCQELNWKTHLKSCNLLIDIVDQYFMVQVPAPIPVFVLTNSITKFQLPRFSFSCQNAQLQFSNSPDSFCKLEGQLIRVAKYKSTSENDNVYLLPEQYGIYESFKSTYCGICFVCDCKGPTKNGSCCKCNTVQSMDEIIIKEAETLQQNALIHLLFIKNNRPLMKKFNFDNVEQLINEQFLKRAEVLLKKNILHHLCLPVLHINMRILQILSYITTSSFVTFNKSINISIFSLCYSAFKSALHHFGVSDTTFQTLLLCTKLLNAYTLSELESIGPPPLQQNYDPETHEPQMSISDERFYEIQSAAGPLLDTHQQALVFGNELYAMAKTLQDEKIILEVENLIGQIDCRIENLESWLEGDSYENTDDNLVVYGEQFNEKQSNLHKQEVDIFK